MDTHRIIEVAERLSQTPGPAFFRSAVSRAYYAAYNVAAEFLSAMGFAKAGKDYHVALRHRLLNSRDDAFKKIGSQLGDFHQKRIQADYHMDDPSTESKKE